MYKHKVSWVEMLEGLAIDMEQSELIDVDKM